jgi:nucleoside-diphosphate-sugar epimerase
MSTSIFITGGAGYCGSRLVPQLLEKGHEVTVYDIMYFGNSFLPLSNPKLKVISGDIRDSDSIKKHCEGHDIFISLACISNDASFELDEHLSTSVNLDAFEPMVLAAKSSGIKRFIYASSSSVYGVSDKPNVTEDHPLIPLTLYNKYKGMCEPLLQKHTNKDFVGVIFRPATVCGYAPRQRLDLSVNILTNHAINKNHITVFGGDQLRPNLHIQDYCDVIQVLMNAPIEKVQNEIFNVGSENMSIANIALLVKNIVEKEFPEKGEIGISTTPSDDNRSYHINSDKIKKALGFEPKFNIEYAVKELCESFRENKLPNSFENDIYFNVKRLKNLQAA